MVQSAINILMYHSIAAGDGPTRIAPETFRRQMAVLEGCGYRGVSLAEALPILRGEKTDSSFSRAVVLTFDDGYEDFATVAFPELRQRGWGATVYLPAGKMGWRADWDGLPAPRLMTWPTVVELVEQGVDFGGHGVTHADLTSLPPTQAAIEIQDARSLIEDRIGKRVATFAPPFGRSNRALRAEIGRHYQASVGTRLGQATQGWDRFNLPRIEMWYFRDPNRWRAFLQGSARGYFLLRKALRKVRALAVR